MVGAARENVEPDFGLVESLALGRAVLRSGGEDDVDAYRVEGVPTLSDGRQVLVPDREANRVVLRDFEWPVLR